MNHPIDVPRELFADWLAEGRRQYPEPSLIAGFVAEKAAEWAADEELKACCKCLIDFDWDEGWSGKLREARRPKPLSLKEQARNALEVCVYGDPIQDDKVRAYNTIRRALDALPD